ncbi:hypothetical protein NEIPOLOT_00181 [Neisseria polysaccharea ATCC 43768]|nr:hypothetical protein NEIPOLOT_00181 [Neisseria polysaccharea ATCC 43768]
MFFSQNKSFLILGRQTVSGYRLYALYRNLFAGSDGILSGCRLKAIMPVWQP